MRVQVVLVGIALWAAYVPGTLIAQDREAIPGSLLMAPPQVADALDPFSNEADSADVARLLEEAHAAGGFPAAAEDRVLEARLWRRARASIPALAALDAISSDEPMPLALLEQARVLLESDEDRTAGARAYWAACSAMDGPTKAEIAWDLLAVSTPEERSEWAELEPGMEACEWLRTFWTERAHRMTITPDERLALHYRRLAHAREWYWIPRPRYLKGAASYHGRPESLAFDDRGLIHVRMGAPLTTEGFNEAGAGEPGAAARAQVSSDPGPTADATAGDTVCWPYWRPGGYRIFCFAQHPLRADNDYRLLDRAGGRPGTQFFQKYVLNSNLPDTFIRNAVVHAGPGLGDTRERRMDAVERRGGARHAQLRTRENIDDALQRIPDVPDVRPNVSMRTETLRFLNPTNERWQIWTIVSVRAGDLVTPDDSADGPLRIGGRYSVLGEEGMRIRQLDGAEVAGGSIAEDAGITLRGVFEADPGRLPLTVAVEDRNSPGSGNWFQDTINVPAIGGLPQLSDIAVAQAEGGTWTRDGETFLQVSPAHITNPDGSIHTYFEVYGVDPGTRYDVELRLAPTEAAERIWRLEPDDLGFRLQFTSEMSGEIGRHHLRLDLGDTEPGEYTLSVRIQDEETEAYSLPSVTDVYVADRD